MFQVKGINNFLRHFLTEIFFVRNKLTENHEKIDFWGFIPFDCLISSQIICFIAVKVERSFVKKPKHPKTFFKSKNITLGVFLKSRMSCFFSSQNFFSG